MEKKLSERKQKIIRAVVDEYILSATPISSGEIQTKHFQDISSATIRAELSTLEDMGYLIQPHTSAGRIPSPEAYRLYSKNFLEAKALGSNELAFIDNSFRTMLNGVNDIVKTTAKVISDVTNYTSIIVLNSIDSVKIKEIKLVDLDEHSALVIVITDSGIIKDKVINTDYIINAGYLKDANGLLNKIFSGRMLSELDVASTLVDKELNNFSELLESVIAILRNYKDHPDNEIYLEGTSKFLSHPDSDLESVKNFLALVEHKNEIKMLINDDNDIEFNVKIGKDESKLDKCAIVTARYKVNGKEIGHAGVIGPERMDYNKVMSVLKYVGQALDIMIKPKSIDKESFFSEKEDD